MKRSKSSKQWLKEHFSDQYVKLAQQHGYRSRAVYKLLEIQQKDQLIKPGMVIVDLGAAPGGWSQLCVKLLKNAGKIFALDILPMEEIIGVNFIHGDMHDEKIIETLFEKLAGNAVNLVLSDMAPNLTGIDSVDQPRSMYLAELALDFAEKVLMENGNFLVKVFQGEGFDEYRKNLQQRFKKVVVRKPDASRDRSREMYLLGMGYKKSRLSLL